jgi:sodium transport system permease protein
MNWSIVRQVTVREVRDQMRDRRTLFMIFVLPLLLYPLLGMSLFQVTQFIRVQPTRVQIVGFHEPPGVVKLIREDKGPTETTADQEKKDEDGKPTEKTYHFAEALFDHEHEVRLLAIELKDDEGKTRDELIAAAREAVHAEKYEAVVVFPPDFNRRLEEFRRRLATVEPANSDDKTTGDLIVVAIAAGGCATYADRLNVQIPHPELVYNTAKEKSQLAYVRLKEVLDKWNDVIGKANLASRNLPASTAKPFQFNHNDVADKGERQAALWSKVLPFLLLIWALTGAFYPAIDLCAGEKERGTLETLLSSPAERQEIVWGKLFTVMLFSVATAVLNIVSMGITGAMVLGHVGDFGPPPPMAPIWLFIALLPMSALFSALCLALASLARSTKEGQYYLMPLVLVTMPLVILPMSPGVELNLGMSLLPVTGVVLLLKELLEGNYLQVLTYLPPVVAVTGSCCLLSVRWAVDQFNSESVLFRESERAGLGLWIRHLRRDREDTPNIAAAVLCGVLILSTFFFMSILLQPADGRLPTFAGFIQSTITLQVVAIFLPAMLMTIICTRSPLETLRLKACRWWTIPAAMGLALALHPSVVLLGELLKKLYSVNPNLEQVAKIFDSGPRWQLALLVALTPAICEELAFRGFILSGLRRLGNPQRAILFSAIFFGVSHGLGIQQAISATLIGLVIGFICVRTGSIFPCMAYHLVHNGALVLLLEQGGQLIKRYPQWGWVATLDEKEPVIMSYHPLVITGGIVIAGFILRQMAKLPLKLSDEESLAATIDERRDQPAVAG